MINCREYIYTNDKTRGKGTEKSPYRVLAQVFDKEGNLLAENDNSGNYTIEDMYAFAEKYAKSPCTIEEWKHSH